ncbi:RagB/SusD family nutrient uptake outer membrane protein [Pedobacter antarcticus]|uniref:RagB/SusD family nutrient uptake outer membrane protein n=1 Tax=Pedobacter antarcticus TaxID=34086 RepID=UPI00292FDC62|nr:RagB/SusD family nutrient uptake outer membrane protein [Pedobacter antarcticus]
MRTKFVNTMLIALVIFSIISCKKFVEIDPPKTDIILSEAFKEDNAATSAVLGIYTNMLSNTNFENSGITIFSGLSADELQDFTNNAEQLEFQRNQILPINNTLSSMWSGAFTNLVLINTCIEGLESSTTLSNAVKAQLIGECKFSRAFLNFYLLNLWDKIPLVTSSDWRLNAVIAQSDTEEVYSAIINDLKAAQSSLSENYPTSGKVRPNKWAATALLARAYLYHREYAAAEVEASTIIESGVYGPLAGTEEVFLKDSHEAIWQLMPTIQNLVLNTTEGDLFLRDIDQGSVPNYIITKKLLNSFEATDQRKISWINQVDVSDETYFYPFKYKDRGSFGVAPTEYYVMLRLAEQYLIRAESRVQLGKLTESMNDLNVIRNRAGLSRVQEIVSAVDKDNLLSAVENENRHEFFIEWGHRWMDLKRTGRINAVMSTDKPTWKAISANFPIPQSELNVNRKLIQNPGY